MLSRATLVVGIICTLSLGTAISAAQNSEVPERFVDLANNCESNIMRLHNIHSMAGEDGLIIAISRLGNGERSRNLNHRRLYNARLWLERIRDRRSSTIITAEGERVGGRGRIEIYVGGKLVDILGMGQGEDLAVGSCDGTGEIDHLYYGSRRQLRRVRQRSSPPPS